jgi:pimeloyl-ACP methyl ester carboxylesterase
MPVTSAPESRRLDEDGYGVPAGPGWREVDWRRHQRWEQVEGRWINLVDIGSGPPVVLIHGLSGSWPNWLENISYLAQRHRVIAMDLPGFGHSEMPSEKISISGYARTVDALCDRLELGEAADVVGNSMGGFVAAELAIAVPARVERLVLVSAAGLSIENVRRDPLLAAARITEAYAAWFASRSRAFALRPRLRRATLGVVARHPDRLRGDIAYELLAGSGKPGFVDALDALTNYSIRDRLPQIGCPTLIVWGDGDLLVPVKDASEFERLIPNSRKVIFADTGHIPMVERPERFNRLVGEFLAE